MVIRAHVSAILTSCAGTCDYAHYFSGTNTKRHNTLCSIACYYSPNIHQIATSYPLTLCGAVV